MGKGGVSAAQERPTTTWAGRVQRTGRGWLGSPISFEQWITDLPISGRQTCMTDGGVGAEVEDSLKGSLGGGYGQKKEPTALKGMLRISVEGRWAGDREKISLRAVTDSLHLDGAEHPCCEWERVGMAGNYLGGGKRDTRMTF